MNFRIPIIVTAIFLASGCETLSYYSQAIRGQLGLMGAARPIEAWLADPATPPELRERLEAASRMREFASRSLALPDNGSYASYAELGRPYAVWNVYAAPRFSVEAKQECFPFAGCVSYRGFFSEEDARRHAARLREEGNDVYLGGVPAYSTLGWLDDPLLSTFIRYPDVQLARLMFHELAHQRVYLKGDTAFNESFAVAVEEEGVRRWLERNGTPAERDAYAAVRQRRADFVRLVLRYQERLDALYRETLPDEAKREGKRKRLAEMDADYRALKERSWGGFAGYDRWFDGGVNNAKLASVATYEELVPAFRALLAREQGDLPRFYAAVKALAALDKPQRDRELAALTPR